MRPNTTLRVPIKIDGLGAGDEARVVVAAVDVGILNLTNYKPPAPDEYYLGQRQLSAELRDLYGQLIDGMQGTRGQIRTGGDARRRAERQPADAGAARALLRHRRGAVRTAGRGRVRHSGLRRHRARHGGGLEQGQGRPRLRRRDRARSGGADRDACRASCSPATSSTMHLDLDNVEGAAGDYNLTVSAEGTVAVGEGGAKSLQLRAKQRDRVTVPLNASRCGRRRPSRLRSRGRAISRSNEATR